MVACSALSSSSFRVTLVFLPPALHITGLKHPQCGLQHILFLQAQTTHSNLLQLYLVMQVVGLETKDFFTKLPVQRFGAVVQNRVALTLHVAPGRLGH